MKMRILILVACTSLIAVAALAHNGEEHVIGTVANVGQNSISVKTTANIVTVAVIPETKFIKDKVGAKIGDLNVGDRVVIHAKEPAEGKLVADTVEFASAKSSQSGPAQAPIQPKIQTLTGIVSDSTCGGTHTMKNMSAAACTRMCVTAGQKYALVVGNRVYTLQGHEVDLQKFAGGTVTVQGRMAGNSVTVDSVAPTKKG